MPTYDFRCPSGHDSEHFFRKFSDAPTEVRCPECGAEAVRRVSGGAGLVFKGSGFYLTDYGKNAHRKPAADGSKADGKADSGGAKAESSKSDSAGGSGSDRGSDSGSSSPKAESAKPSETKAPTIKSKSSDGQ
jgi:putative FmdB family regulatory protein